MPFWDNWFKRKDNVNLDADLAQKPAVQPGRVVTGAPVKMNPPTTVGRDPVQILETVATYNPDASLAIWNYVRMITNGWALVAKDMVSGEVDTESQDRLLRRCDDVYGVYGYDYGGGLSQLLDVLTVTALTQGAICGEVEISKRKDDVLDWIPIDPRLIVLKRDDKTGKVNRYYHKMGSDVLLSPDQVRYIPVDPLLDTPYGRAPLMPLLESVFFQTEVLKDLKMVAHTQGHPRITFTVLEEIALQHAPAYLTEPGREDELSTWMAGWLTDLADQYKTLEPDDALFMWDWIKVGNISAGSGSFNAESLMRIVEQQVISSTKHLPMLLGRVEGSGLAHGSVQWQVFALGVESLRSKMATLVAWWATQTLRLWGVNSVGELEFESLRTQDRLREAQSEQIEQTMWLQRLALGVIDVDEFAEHFAGHPATNPQPLPAEVPEPAPVAEEEMTMEEGAGERGTMPVKPTSVLDESLYFDKLPGWMRARITGMERQLKRVSSERRAGAFAAVMGNGGNGNG